MSRQLYYHYTSESAFVNILKTNSVYASYYNVLNDKTELNFCKRKIKLELKKIYAEDREFGIVAFQEGLTRAIELGLDSVGAFVFSMSRKRDDLSQWLGYGDFGRGVVIGFELLNELGPKLPGNFVDHNENERLLTSDSILHSIEINYYNSETKRLISNYIETGLHKYESAIKNSIFSEIDYIKPTFESLSQKMINDLTLAIISVKNIYFKFEEEVRLVCLKNLVSHSDEVGINTNKVDYRVGNDRIIPFLAIPFNQSFRIKEVVLGPRSKSNRFIVKNFIENYLSRDLDIRVTNSKIPLS